MLPNVSIAVELFQQPIELVHAEKMINDGLEKWAIFDYRQLEAVIQPADKEKLSNSNVEINWAVEILMVHSTELLKINDYFIYKDKVYKSIAINDYDDYGYYESVAEQTKGNLTKEILEHVERYR